MLFLAAGSWPWSLLSAECCVCRSRRPRGKRAHGGSQCPPAIDCNADGTGRTRATNEEDFPLNNNRNNRRRGRGNRNQSGGGNQLNRIDSRARGNAPQLLDKYKKLAQDAQHNGDRVQAEYYLQFADHYFRVIADNKARQDEARNKRGDNRGDGQDDGDGRYDDGADSDRTRESRRSSPKRQRSRRDDDDSADYDGDYGADSDSDESEGVNGRAYNGRAENSRSDDDRADDGRSERDVSEEAPKRRARKPKSETPRKPRKSRKSDDEDSAAGIDSSVLPPAIRGNDLGSGDSDGALETVD
ncbi:MAG: DUF4167 domain-containing protein [Erythrobacter sp.]|nr:DUF4167 domain-containing protein [Erythrobacter sp.]